MKFLFSIIFLFATFSAHAQSNTIARIKETGVIKIGVRTNADPFSSYQDNQGNGYMVELCNNIVEEIQKEIGKKISTHYIPVTPSNRFELIETNKVDMECGTTTVNRERRTKVDFSYNTFITSTNFITLSTNKDKVKSPKDFYDFLHTSGQKMAIMKGTSHEDMIKKSMSGRTLNVLQVHSIEEGLTKVFNGEAFSFIQDKVLIEKGISNLNLDKTKISFFQEPVSIEPYSIMVKKGDTEMLSFVNTYLRQSYSSGQARKILNKWLQPKQISPNYLTVDNFKTPSTENSVN